MPSWVTVSAKWLPRARPAGLRLEDAVAVVYHRSRLMQTMAGPGQDGGRGTVLGRGAVGDRWL
jgi:hypothetical protein